jgi:hydrogenase maturation protein HypF
MMSLVGCDRVDVVACDSHPDFLSTELAEKLSDEKSTPLVRVQHHHAHLAGLVVDSGMDCNTDITCITADGYGFGLGGEAWGGEVLVGNCRDFRRVGGLMPRNIPGGDLAARYAVRSLIGILDDVDEVRRICDITRDALIGPSMKATPANLDMMSNAIERNINVMKSSSAGRFLDAVSAALGICFENSYDGECPMKLEAVAKETSFRIEPHIKTVEGRLVLDTSDMLRRIVEMKQARRSVGELSYAAQDCLGRGLAQVACIQAQETGIPYVGFSGGVALNRIITAAVAQSVAEEGLRLLLHEHFPPGDGCVSLGQIAVASKSM